ncbi:hypothetical protein [Pectobacterium parvum]|uniref:hypothetical protein n=1 Tax=Pectobacterium parvum TaxID=2778550 RepID=UPI0021C9EEB2|nr:hypothetical protein [Pectobacterium parvum]MCU1803436.1 hypothetical protein [Pectobacterium parvum]
MQEDIITSKNGKGIFNRKDWLDESKKLYLSAKLLRECSEDNKELLRDNGGDIPYNKACDYIDMVSSTAKTSRLLLGYSFEMLLKSAILLMNYGARKETLDKIFREYGHNLDRMAADLGLMLNKDEMILLKLSADDIVLQARYPIKVEDDDKYIDELNERNSQLASNKTFYDMVFLYDKIKSIVAKFDRDVNNCADFNKFRCNDFILFMRSGGGLKSRAIVSFSSSFIASNKNKLFLKSFIQEHSGKIALLYIWQWDSFEFFEDTGKKLLSLG